MDADPEPRIIEFDGGSTPLGVGLVYCGAIVSHFVSAIAFVRFDDEYAASIHARANGEPANHSLQWLSLSWLLILIMILVLAIHFGYGNRWHVRHGYKLVWTLPVLWIVLRVTVV